MLIKDNNSFLQSKNWADFQKSLGRKIWQIEGINIIKHNLPIKKSYLYSPRPNFATQNLGGQARFEKFLTKIKEIAKQENAIFLKVEPLDFARGNSIELEKFGFRKSTNIQPAKTLILDITKPEKEILEKMHYKTRYNIKLAEKRVKAQISPASPSEAGRANSLPCRQAGKFQNFEEFWRLIIETTKRGKFRPHPKEYYRKMLQIPGVELFLAEYEKRILVANIVVFWGKTAIYLHGASDYENRNLMASHLLQWEQIKEAKKRGCEEYDFWGIDEKKWPGVTRFKKGFGGQEIIYPGAYDLVFEKFWYLVYKIARKIL